MRSTPAVLGAFQAMDNGNVGRGLNGQWAGGNASCGRKKKMRNLLGDFCEVHCERFRWIEELW